MFTNLGIHTNLGNCSFKKYLLPWLSCISPAKRAGYTVVKKLTVLVFMKFTRIPEATASIWPWINKGEEDRSEANVKCLKSLSHYAFLYSVINPSLYFRGSFHIFPLKKTKKDAIANHSNSTWICLKLKLFVYSIILTIPLNIKAQMWYLHFETFNFNYKMKGFYPSIKSF